MAASAADMEVKSDDVIVTDEEPSMDIMFKKVGPDVRATSREKEEEGDKEQGEEQGNPLLRAASLLAVSNTYGLVVFGDSHGFCAGKTQKILEASQALRESAGNGGCPGVLADEAIVRVGLPGIRMLKLSCDELTLAVCTREKLHFYDMHDLVEEKKTNPFESRIVSSQGAWIREFSWSPTAADQYMMVLSSKKMTTSRVGSDELLGEREDVISASWSPDGKSICRSSPDGILSISSLKLSKGHSIKLPMTLPVDSEDCKRSVDSLRWVRDDSILVGYVEDREDEEEVDYPLLLLHSPSGLAKGVDGIKYYQMYGLCPTIESNATEPETGPYLLAEYLDAWGMAVVVNRKSVDNHINVIQWREGDDANAPAQSRVPENDAWMARIELTESGEDSTVLGLALDKTVGLRVIDPNDDSGGLLPGMPVLICLTSEGCLCAFTFARLDEHGRSTSTIRETAPSIPSKRRAAGPAEPLDMGAEGPISQVPDEGKKPGIAPKDVAVVGPSIQAVPVSAAASIALPPGTSSPAALPSQGSVQASPLPPAPAKKGLLLTPVGAPSTATASLAAATVSKSTTAQKSLFSLKDSGASSSFGSLSAAKAPSVFTPTTSSLSNFGSQFGSFVKPIPSSGQPLFEAITQKLQPPQHDASTAQSTGLSTVSTTDTASRRIIAGSSDEDTADSGSGSVTEDEQEQGPGGVAGDRDVATYASSVMSPVMTGLASVQPSGQTAKAALQSQVNASNPFAVRTGASAFSLPERPATAEGPTSKNVPAMPSYPKASLPGSGMAAASALSVPVMRPGATSVMKTPGFGVTPTSTFSLAAKPGGSSSMPWGQSLSDPPGKQQQGRAVGSAVPAGPAGPSLRGTSHPSQAQVLSLKSQRRTVVPPPIEREFLPDLDKVRQMSDDLDHLICSINRRPGTTSSVSKRIFIEDDVVDVEEQLSTFSQDLKKLKEMSEEMWLDLGDLQDRTMQVRAWKVHLQSLFEQNLDERHDLLWDAQRLDPSMEAQRKSVMKKYETVKEQLGDLHNHLQVLELKYRQTQQMLNRAGHGRQARQKAAGAALSMQSMPSAQSLYNTVNSYLGIAEGLAKRLSLQMDQLSLRQSPSTPVRRASAQAVLQAIGASPEKPSPSLSSVSTSERSSSPMRRGSRFPWAQVSRASGAVIGRPTAIMADEDELDESCSEAGETLSQVSSVMETPQTASRRREQVREVLHAWQSVRTPMTTIKRGVRSSSSEWGSVIGWSTRANNSVDTGSSPPKDLVRPRGTSQVSNPPGATASAPAQQLQSSQRFQQQLQGMFNRQSQTSGGAVSSFPAATVLSNSGHLSPNVPPPDPELVGLAMAMPVPSVKPGTAAYSLAATPAPAFSGLTFSAPSSFGRPGAFAGPLTGGVQGTQGFATTPMPPQPRGGLLQQSSRQQQQRAGLLQLPAAMSTGPSAYTAVKEAGKVDIPPLTTGFVKGVRPENQLPSPSVLLAKDSPFRQLNGMQPGVLKGRAASQSSLTSEVAKQPEGLTGLFSKGSEPKRVLEAGLGASSSKSLAAMTPEARPTSGGLPRSTVEQAQLAVASTGGSNQLENRGKPLLPDTASPSIAKQEVAQQRAAGRQQMLRPPGATTQAFSLGEQQGAARNEGASADGEAASSVKSGPSGVSKGIEMLTREVHRESSGAEEGFGGTKEQISGSIAGRPTSSPLPDSVKGSKGPIVSSSGVVASSSSAISQSLAAQNISGLTTTPSSISPLPSDKTEGLPTLPPPLPSSPSLPPPQPLQPPSLPPPSSGAPQLAPSQPPAASLSPSASVSSFPSLSGPSLSSSSSSSSTLLTGASTSSSSSLLVATSLSSSSASSTLFAASSTATNLFGAPQPALPSVQPQPSVQPEEDQPMEEIVNTFGDLAGLSFGASQPPTQHPEKEGKSLFGVKVEGSGLSQGMQNILGALPSGEIFKPPSFSLPQAEPKAGSSTSSSSSTSPFWTANSTAALGLNNFGNQPAGQGPQSSAFASAGGGQQPGFGVPAQPAAPVPLNSGSGGAAAVVGKALGAFGQTRTLGASAALPGLGTPSTSAAGFAAAPTGGGFASAATGGGFASTATGGGFASAATGGGFAAVAGGAGGFAAAATGSGGFAAAATGGGGFAGVTAASGGGFAGAAGGGGGFAGFARGGGGFASAPLPASRSPVDSKLFTEMRR